MKPIVMAIGSVLVLATLLPLLQRPEWWIRIFDYPRSQIAALLGAAVAAFLFFYDGGVADIAFIGAMLAALGYQITQIFPYTPLASVQVLQAVDGDPSARLRLLIANVLMDNRDKNTFLDLVRAAEPDVLLAVETDAWWDRELSALDQSFPHKVKLPLQNTYGLHLYSKLELGSPQIEFLVEQDIPSVHAAIRLRSGQWIDFYGVHPRPPRPAQDTEERDAEILIIGRAARKAARPAIVAGDLNDVAWSHTTRLFQRISGLLDPRIGRGMFSTFNANWPIARWPLDHIFSDTSFKLREIRRLGYFGSDHFPVLVELSHEPGAAAEQEAPSPEPGDQREASDKIRNGSS